MSPEYDDTMVCRATLRLLFRLRRHSGAARAECMRAVESMHLPCVMALRAVLRSVI